MNDKEDILKNIRCLWIVAGAGISLSFIGEMEEMREGYVLLHQIFLIESDLLIMNIITDVSVVFVIVL